MERYLVACHRMASEKRLSTVKYVDYYVSPTAERPNGYERALSTSNQDYVRPDRAQRTSCTMTEKLSAFLIVKNEAERLPRTLNALRGLADEIVVVDSGSTDTTVEIAKEYGARVFVRDWPGYGPQKRFGEDQCQYDWLLNVDADEMVTPELAKEIRSTIEAGEGAAWRIRIREVYPGNGKPRPLINDYNVVRLYHRSVGRYRDSPLFDRVELTVKPGQLRAPIWHYSFVSWHALVDKANTYSSYYAKMERKRSRAWLRCRLFIEFPLVFLKVYFLRLHCLGGWKGYVISASAAYMRLIRLTKMLERLDE